MAEILLPAWSQQGSSLRAGVVTASWLGHTGSGGCPEPWGKPNIPAAPWRREFAPAADSRLFCNSSFSCRQWARPEQPSVTVPAGQQNSYRLDFPQFRYPRTGACTWGRARGGWPLSRLSPAQDKGLCVGDATCHLHSHHAELPCLSPPWSQAGSGTLALAKAEGQLRHRDQDGAEDGSVALGQDLGVLSHHLQHHVPHFLGDVPADVQQGGDVFIAGQRARGEPGCPASLPQSREAKPQPGESWCFAPSKIAFS